jgi:hypothetical protein
LLDQPHAHLNTKCTSSWLQPHKSYTGSFNIIPWCTYKTYKCTITSITRASPAARLYLNLVVRCDYSLSGCTSSTTPMTCIRTRHLAVRLLVGQSDWLSPCVCTLRLAARLRHRLSLLSSPTGSTLETSCAATTRLPIASAIHHLHRAPRLIVTQSHWLYVNLERAPRVLVSRTQRLYVNYAARPGASAPRATRRRLFRLRHASRCLGSSRGSSLTTCLGASGRRTARC